MSRRKRRRFTPEFKAETVRLVEESDKSIGELAKELDLTESVLRGSARSSSTSPSTFTR